MKLDYKEGIKWMEKASKAGYQVADMFLSENKENFEEYMDIKQEISKKLPDKGRNNILTQITLNKKFYRNG